MISKVPFVVLVAGLVLALGACAPAVPATPTVSPPTVSPAAAPTKAPAAATATTAPAPAKASSPAAATPTVAALKPLSPPVQVRFGTGGAVSDGAVFIAIEKGFFKNLGLDVQVIPGATGSAMIAPLVNGDLDIAGGDVSTGLLNAMERAVKLKIVAPKSASTKGFDSDWITVRKDLVDSGQVKDIKDLKGKKVAVGGIKSGAEAEVAMLLKQAGLTLNDIDLVTIGYPDMISAYGNKAIDAAQQFETNVTRVVEQGLAVRWPPGQVSAIFGGKYQASVLVYSEKFSQNQDVARRFMIGYLQGARAYLDAFAKGIGKDQVISILTKDTNVQDPAIYAKMQMPYMDPDGKIDTSSIKIVFDYFKQMGYYTGNLQFQSLFDSQFTDFAVPQLGPYK